MTVIVAVKGPEGVVMGADSQTTCGWEPSTRVQPKIFERNAGGRLLYFGVAGNVRLSDIIRYAELPDGASYMDAHQWLTTALVPALREASKASGWTEVEKNREDNSGAIIVVTGGRIFKVDNTWSVHEPARPYWAIGSGGDHAAGAIAVLLQHTPELGIRGIVLAALEAACVHCIGCGAPLHVVECGS